MAIISSKHAAANLMGRTSTAHQPGLSDYVLETRMLMGEHRVEDCLKGLSDATLNSLGFDRAERARLKGRADTA